MTAHECLLHSWLTGDHSDRSAAISASRYTKLRDKIRKKYDHWEDFVLPLGRLSEYSCLRKLLIEKYRIHETSFGEYSTSIMKKISKYFRIKFLLSVQSKFTSLDLHQTLYRILMD